MITLLAFIALGRGTTITGVVLDHGKGVAGVAVWLEDSNAPKPVTATVSQKRKRFTPHVLVVPVGSKVEFLNEDDIFHNVYAEFNAKRFDLGIYPKGQSRSVSFDKTGVVSVLCNIHTDMSAYVVVVPSNVYAITDRDGHFTLKGAESDHGVLKAWH
jgi:plastocyanin